MRFEGENTCYGEIRKRKVGICQMLKGKCEGGFKVPCADQLQCRGHQGVGRGKPTGVAGARPQGT